MAPGSKIYALIIFAYSTVAGADPFQSADDSPFEIPTASCGRGDPPSQIAACSLLIAQKADLTALEKAKIYKNRGIAYARTNDQDKAIEDYDAAAIKLGLEDHSLYKYRAIDAAKHGHIDQAISDYTSALKLLPNTSRLLGYRCGAYLSKGSVELALTDCNAAVKISPGNGSALGNRCIALLEVVLLY